MTDANLLPYYPKFIFNCSDGNCLSTGDLGAFHIVARCDINPSNFQADKDWTPLKRQFEMHP